jgi:hypothetical protein
MNRTLVLTMLVLSTVTVALGAAGQAKTKPRAAAPVYTEEVFTQPSLTIDLAASVGGIVRAVDAGEGATVKAEAPIIRLDDSVAVVAVRVAQLAAEDKSEEQSALATLQQARYEANISAKLAKENLEAELLAKQKQMAADAALARYEGARKKREKAALDLEAARISLARYTIKAPVAALVTRMPKEPGEAVQPLETVAQLSVVDPLLIEKLSEMLLPKSPIRLPTLSTHPEKRALTPLIGLETGSVRMAKEIMPGKAAPFPIDEWPSVFVRGLEVLNRHNWFPAVTLIVGSPGETDEDNRATLDLIYEVERRGLFAFFIPSIFTPLHDTRMEQKKGVTETRELTPLQWQLMMRCWKMNMRPGQISWWAPTAWRLGALLLWAWKLRRLNGPNFTWALLNFASALPERLMGKLGKLHTGRPLAIKTRRELLETVKPHQRRYLRRDNGDMPDSPSEAAAHLLGIPVLASRNLEATADA